MVTMPKQSLRLHGRGENFKRQDQKQRRQRRGRKVEATTKKSETGFLQDPPVIFGFFDTKQKFLYKIQIVSGMAFEGVFEPSFQVDFMIWIL